jgi:hypothetical protein
MTHEARSIRFVETALSAIKEVAMFKTHLKLVGSLAVVALMAVSKDAKAGVSNPGTFDFNITSGHDSLFQFKSGEKWFIDDGGVGFLEADVDSAGGMSSFSGDLGTGSFNLSGSTLSSTILIQSATSGIVNVTTSTIQFDLSFKVRFAVGGFVCTTSAFSITLSTSNWVSGGGGACSTGYDESTGDFCVLATGFTVPQLPATACNNQGNAINSLLGLGISSGTEMQILLGNVSPIIHD